MASSKLLAATAVMAVAVLAQPFTPSGLEAVAPIGFYQGVVLQPFGNVSTPGNTEEQRCGGPFSYGSFTAPRWPVGTPSEAQRALPFEQLSDLRVAPYGFDWQARTQVEPLVPGGLLVQSTPYTVTAVSGSNPIPSAPGAGNIFTGGWYGSCWWAEAALRPDGLGYDILFVELGGKDWAFDLNDESRPWPLAPDAPPCNSVTYRQTLARMQPNWKNVPVCVEGTPGSGLKQWSRIHRYSPENAPLYSAWPVPGSTLVRGGQA